MKTVSKVTWLAALLLLALAGAASATHRTPIALFGAFVVVVLGVRTVRRGALKLDMRRALAAGEFDLFYQPLVNLHTKEVTGFEALLRWRHPKRGLLSPSEFIPLAEDSGVIIPLGEWMIRKACQEAARWPSNISVAVNLSPAQFSRGNPVDVVKAALARAGLHPSRLELGITEAVLLGEVEATLSTLHQLRNIGVRLSMDDVGADYSSLNLLRSLPFDKIKIDRPIVRHLSSREDCLAILRTVTGLGITTTAKGVETQEQVEKLRAEGCTEVQGQVVGQPRPIEDYAEFLGQQPHSASRQEQRRTQMALAV